MNKTLAAALLSVFIATPAFAADTATSTPSKKPAAQKRADRTSDNCDSWHNMSAYHGHGMSGGYGGMMGGYGGGMMGGYGGGMMSGPGRMLDNLSLSKEQQAKVNKISDQLKHDNWATMGQMNDETAKLRDLYQADKRDPAAIDAEYQKVFDLKRQMIRTYLEAENKIEDALTAEQLAKLKENRSQMHRNYMGR